MNKIQITIGTVHNIKYNNIKKKITRFNSFNKKNKK